MYNLDMLLYALDMFIVSVSEARQELAAVIKNAQSEPVTIERRGVPQAIVLSPAAYEQLIAASEEAADIAAFDEAMAEEGPNIPWEQVKADLGW